MHDETVERIQQDYDCVAEEYARRVFHELDDKPLDRELLTRFAAERKDQGAICDLGCGPGHVARFLHGAGAPVFGVDLSPGMLEQARRLNPEIEFRQGNMLALELPDASLAGIAAFYSIVNLPPATYPQVFREIARVLRPEGMLLLGFHIGEETLHRDEWWDRPIDMDFYFLDPIVVEHALEAAGFVVEELIEREPYPEVEYPSRRGYLLARKARSGGIQPQNSMRP